MLDDDLREAINRGASEPEMRRLAAGKGLVSMREVGYVLLQDGMTDRAELLRVLGSELGGF
jgi:type II secretory ATPase GspE/PulE/Tfp pilus assembly ATPase PilB-like protein